MLQVSNISVQFSGKYLFDSVNFAVLPGDRLAVIGRNGAGKTTLMRVIAGEMSPEKGNIVIPKEYKIGFLPQELQFASTGTVYSEAASAMVEIRTLEARAAKLAEEVAERTDYESDGYMKLVHEMTEIADRLKILGAQDADAAIERTLLGLGFDREDLHRKASEFSGGWQMRIELAKILLSQPDCILLDEPTNHLDIDSIKWLESFLKGFSGAALIISHDRRFLDNVTNRTVEISAGKVYDMPLPYSKFIEAREMQKKQQLSAYQNQQRQIAEQEKYIERFRYKATLASRVQSRIKQLEKIERIELDEEEVKAIHLRFPEPVRPARVIAEAKNLSKSYGELRVLRNISFALERGEKVAFVGRNGEGKTTFAKILAGEEEYDGELVRGANVKIGYYAQHRTQELPMDYTAFDVIDKAAVGEIRSQIRNILGAFLFSGAAVEKKVKMLSGGEKSRLSLAKLLLEPNNFLALDEPTNHLDIVSKDILKQALQEFGGALVIVSHDRDFLAGLTTKTYEFRGGHIREYIGDIDYYLSRKAEEEAQTETDQRVKITDGAPKASQVSREKKKEYLREENKLQKQITSVEEKVEKTEEKIAVLEEEFSREEIFSNPDLLRAKKDEYSKLSNDLEMMMQDWERLSGELEELKNAFFEK